LAGEHPVFEWIHLDPDKHEIPCETSLSRMPPFERNLIRANVADITKRVADKKHEEELQAQLAASQRLETIGQLTGGVAHDFNNLLAVILGNLEFLQDEFIDEKKRKLLQPCIDATLRGADLTRSMLSYARKAPLQPRVLDLNKLVSETKNWAGRTLPSYLMNGLWNVNADPSATESALLNLILNARDAMPENGTLTIETTNIRIEESYLDHHEEIEPGQYVMVSVSDTGVGIKEEIIE